MKDKTNCRHSEKSRKILKFYRKNYPFGRKSEIHKYSVRMCKEVCEDCGKEFGRWKP